MEATGTPPEDTDTGSSQFGELDLPEGRGYGMYHFRVLLLAFSAKGLSAHQWASTNLKTHQTMETVMLRPKCPLTDEWIKKMWYATEYFSAIKNNETTCNNTDVPRGYYAK